MEITNKQVFTFALNATVHDVTVEVAKLELDTGFFDAWFKNVLTADVVLTQILAGWKIKDRDQAWRPFFIDQNAAAQDHNVPNYANINDIAAADQGYAMADGLWHHMLLANPNGVAIIPMLVENDIIQIQVIDYNDTLTGAEVNTPVLEFRHQISITGPRV